jgi:MSHA biogenesis protein MshO
MQYMKTRGQQIIARQQTGFTLLEIVMVIVLLGVIGSVGADFIAQMFRGFAATNTRLEIYEEGKTAMARMERELHGMLPNGICVTNDRGASCESNGTAGNEIRFGMILEDVMRNNNLIGGYTETAINFPRTAPATLSEINPSGVPRIGDIVSVYNTSWSSFATGARLFRITGVGGNIMTFAGQSIVDPSPQRRYYLLDRGVSYRWDATAGTLYRSVVSVSESGIGNFSSAVEYPLARDVGDFKFYYMAPSLSRNGIISLVFTMVKDNHNIVMHKEVHVKNVP